MLFPARNKKLHFLLIFMLFAMMTVWMTIYINQTAENYDGVRPMLSHVSLPTRRYLQGFIANENDFNDYMSKFRRSMAEERIVNNHSFRYILQPKNLCSNGMFLVTYVHSAPTNNKRRMIIRNTWGNPANVQKENVKIKVFFVIGVSLKPLVNEAIQFESERYGDVLQEDFLDSYHNLTYKGIAALKYISHNCRNVPYVLKTDDDIFVNIFSLIHHLQTISAPKHVDTTGRNPTRVSHKEQFLLCLAWSNMKVMRTVKSKWYVSKEDWHDDVFPTYCSGSAFVLSRDVAVKIYNASLYTPPFWIDDLYITGLLPLRLGLHHVQFSKRYELQFSKFEESYKKNPNQETYIFSHENNLNSIQRLWNRITLRKGMMLENKLWFYLNVVTLILRYIECVKIIGLLYQTQV